MDLLDEVVLQQSSDDTLKNYKIILKFNKPGSMNLFLTTFKFLYR